MSSLLCEILFPKPSTSYKYNRPKLPELRQSFGTIKGLKINEHVRSSLEDEFVKNTELEYREYNR